eukprot:CAMPEP_0197654420 /NCGR_PEP_ID=MMETSP1338-20131121/38841_1 /TAXON_ID=43686 ORGANISM="Pelagodinium beii, Strain RCC1491" /NCGR_SAMPLE_ID=MMETSP1338 /ASSEMBLY_ACC=CAM_ASM_000754 /LENGTH=388 /DNA_ID=CAMNT_0043229863 /DNA_START=41 /DNA_END=1207 /DNA_ORIENTATION=+
MAAAEVFWWKFAAGSGSHLIRVKNPGTDVQEVMLDGAVVEAPPGTLAFTGPAATFLQLEDRGYGQWALLADGAEVSPYVPEGSSSAPSQICWWKLEISGTGTHHVRVKDIGTSRQQVWIDGAPLEAPPGTMTFTGPAACLLELVQRDGTWILTADGYPHHQQNPSADSAPALCWEFDLETGHHTLAARCINESGQQFLLDGTDIQAPAGSLAFTGPGGTLLELRQAEDGAWHLVLEGTSLGAGLASFEAADAPIEAYFEFVVPSTGSQHCLQVSNVGRQGQLVWIDSIHVDCPDGTLMFTGPAGSLLEMKLQDNRWMLYLDGTCVSLPNSGGPRVPVMTGGSLPQGVSIDPDTNKYTAAIRVGGRFKNLGSFDTPEEASRRYQEAKAA